jgi:hypothetical protein
VSRANTSWSAGRNTLSAFAVPWMVAEGAPSRASPLLADRDCAQLYAGIEYGELPVNYSAFGIAWRASASSFRWVADNRRGSVSSIGRPVP